jgi:hypothetical protein
MTTIPRNHTRKIADIRERLTSCRVFTLENYFRGEEVDARHAWASLARSAHARLTLDPDGARAVVHIHSNCWYELTPTETPEEETR